MVLQYCNVSVERLDNDINNNSIDSDYDSESEFCYQEYHGTYASETIEELFATTDFVLYDCDQLLDSDANNTLNEGQDVRDAIELIASLRKVNKKIIFTSNRCDKTRQQMLIRLNDLGINASINDMFPSSYATAVYLKAIEFERQVFVVGSHAIEQELHEMGIESTGLGCHSKSIDISLGFGTFNLSPKVGAVVVSLDHQIPLADLVQACSYATKPDCLFIVANYDDMDADPEPAAQVSAIQVVANKGFISLGKSHRLYFHCIRQTVPHFDCNKAVIITDRLPDMAFGPNINIKTIFIESNIQTGMRWARHHHFRPDYLVDSLSSLTQLFSK